MKVIEPYYEILPELPGNPTQQIADRSRICYKSEDKAKQDESPFVNGIIKHGHNSCLEMAVKTFKISNVSLEDYISLLKQKYLIVDVLHHFRPLGKDAYRPATHAHYVLAVTGSIRAFREYLKASYASLLMSSLIFTYFITEHPNLFFDIESPIHPIKLTLPSSLTSVTIPDEIFSKKDPKFYRHTHIAVKFFVNRAVTHEIVRHRPCAYLQESQRYCRYSDSKFGNEVTFIKPSAFPKLMEDGNYHNWAMQCQDAETCYLELIKNGVSAQGARTVLPNSCKTELIVYTSLHEWSHILKLRAINEAAEPSMREVMRPLHEDLSYMYPALLTPQLSVG